MFYFRLIAADEMTARNLALSLLSVSEGARQPIGNLVAGAALFDIDGAAMRMAVTRLMRENLLISPARGVYGIGPQAQALSEATQKWRVIFDKTQAWAGDWFVVHTAHLGRTDKKRLRARERALHFYGFAASIGGLWVRPANLTTSLEEISGSLFELGLERDAILLQSRAHIASNPWGELWSREDIEQTYRDAVETMEKSAQMVKEMGLKEAVRETLLVGQSVIRAINLDPLLPEVMVDRPMFEKMVRGMMNYDEMGRELWIRYFASL